ncbi:sensor histidine kinase, partial [Microbacterium trichothecenolyticum]
AAATLAVAAALVLGELEFYAILTLTIHDATVRTAEARAEQLASRIEAEGPSVLAELDDDIEQVLDDD